MQLAVGKKQLAKSSWQLAKAVDKSSWHKQLAKSSWQLAKK
jgi:hypothetical protein